MSKHSSDTGVDPAAPHSLRQRLAVYSAAVGAMAAGAGSAQGAVVYTDLGAGLTTGVDGSVPIDFNGDSIAEFYVTNEFFPSGTKSPGYDLDLVAGPGGVEAAHVEDVVSPAPVAGLPPGFTVGPALSTGYAWNTSSPAKMAYSKTKDGPPEPLPKTKGEFANDTAFIGLRWKFSPTDPDFYYGWVFAGGEGFELNGRVYGYAYEDQVGQAIQTPEPTSLAALAAGATLALRRRRAARA